LGNSPSLPCKVLAYFVLLELEAFDQNGGMVWLEYAAYRSSPQMVDLHFGFR
jgi:hypothetical protein